MSAAGRTRRLSGPSVTFIHTLEAERIALVDEAFDRAPSMSTVRVFSLLIC